MYSTTGRRQVSGWQWLIPERITAIVSQNGNAYDEGLGDAWGPIRKYWAEPTAENREVLRKNILTFEGTQWQYTYGVSDPDSVPPESYTLDAALPRCLHLVQTIQREFRSLALKPTQAAQNR